MNFFRVLVLVSPAATGIEGKHSTLRDCLPRIEDAKEMGFDIVYFPPIHPIGVSHRKGKNNTVTCEPDDVGSPWAIGAKEGGHREVHPDLGTISDLAWLVSEARDRGIEVALDFAIQCSPDHPYVSEHPEWFFHRPDGSIKYAENPPKKYQDTYPINFHCDDWQELWRTEASDAGEARALEKKIKSRGARRFLEAQGVGVPPPAE